MYFTLAVSAATAARCAALTEAARGADPRVMPVPGPARVAWRSPDDRAAVLHWGDPAHAGPACPGTTCPGTGHAATGHAGTIWAEGATVRARTGLTRVNPVYLAEVPGAVVVSDRASWTAAVTGRLRDPDPAMVGAFLSLGYPLGGATPFRGVRALGGDRCLRAAAGRLVVTRRPGPAGDPGRPERSRRRGPGRRGADRGRTAAGRGGRARPALADRG